MGPVVDAAAVGSLLARDANERAMTPEELGQLLVDLVAQGSGAIATMPRPGVSISGNHVLPRGSLASRRRSSTNGRWSSERSSSAAKSRMPSGVGVPAGQGREVV
jgi:hypothetical protein